MFYKDVVIRCREEDSRFPLNTHTLTPQLPTLPPLRTHQSHKVPGKILDYSRGSVKGAGVSQPSMDYRLIVDSLTRELELVRPPPKFP